MFRCMVLHMFRCMVLHMFPYMVLHMVYRMRLSTPSASPCGSNHVGAVYGRTNAHGAGSSAGGTGWWPGDAEP